MKIHQKVNHFPGSYNVCRKDFLGKHLMMLQRIYPDEYDFFPETWNLPTETANFQ